MIGYSSLLDVVEEGYEAYVSVDVVSGTCCFAWFRAARILCEYCSWLGLIQFKVQVLCDFAPALNVLFDKRTHLRRIEVGGFHSSVRQLCLGFGIGHDR